MPESDKLFKELVGKDILEWDDYDWWMEEMRRYGKLAYEEGAVHALYRLGNWFHRGGWEEWAEYFLEKAFESTNWWITKEEGLIYYDFRVERWRSVETGRFVKSPEEWIWGWWL